MHARRSAAPRPVRQPCRRCRCRLGVRKTMGIRGILLTSYQHPAIIPPGRRGRPTAIAALAGERQEEALAWLEQARPRLDAAAKQIAATPEPLTLLHNDTRSDNLRLRE